MASADRLESLDVEYPDQEVDSQEERESRVRFWKRFLPILAVILIIEQCFEEDILRSGATIRNQLEGSSLAEFVEFGSKAIKLKYQYGVYAFMCVFVSPEASLLIYVAYELSCWTNTSMKLVYRQGRPFFYDPIPGKDPCVLTFGMPSGHSLESLILWVGGMMVVNKTLLKELERRSWPRLASALRVFGIIFSLTMTTFAGVSRLFVGRHSLAQAVIGWVLGVGIIRLCFIDLRDWFKLSRRKGRLPVWVGLLVISNTIMFFVKDWTIPSLWLESLGMLCETHPLPTPWVGTFHYRAFNNSSRIFGVIGAELAILLTVYIAKIFGLDENGDRFPSNNLYWIRAPLSTKRKVLTLFPMWILFTILALWGRNFLNEFLDVGYEIHILKGNYELYRRECLGWFLQFFVLFLLMSLLHILLFPVSFSKEEGQNETPKYRYSFLQEGLFVKSLVMLTISLTST